MHDRILPWRRSGACYFGDRRGVAVLRLQKGFISGVASLAGANLLFCRLRLETVAAAPAEPAPAVAPDGDRNAKGSGPGAWRSSTPSRPGASPQLPLPRQLSVTQGGEPEPDTSQLAYVSLLDVPQLAAMREKIVDALTAAGCAVATQHGYIPHITRAYLPAGSGVKAPGEPVPVRLDQVSVWALGGAIRVPMRLQQQSAATYPGRAATDGRIASDAADSESLTHDSPRNPLSALPSLATLASRRATSR